MFINVLSSCNGSGTSKSTVKLIPVESGKEYQYVDKEGKIVINPQFRNATVFREGLALVQSSGDERKWGFISEDGKYAINAQYQSATVFSNGLAWVISENAAPAAIDLTGELKFTLQNAEEVRVFKAGLAAFSVVNEEGEKKWGFVNKTGEVAVNPQFSRVSNFSDGKCGVTNADRKWGFIDVEGKIIINYQFDGAGDFENGKCVVTHADKQGVIDQDGKYIINPQFQNMQIDGDMFLISQDGKWGWCDEEGKVTINTQFSKAFPFNGNEITSVKSGDKYGYVDRDGKFVINPQFDNAMPFSGKLALVVSTDKIGFIDNDGKYVINPQFDGIPNDMFEYFLTGNSRFSNVKTDYFNIEAIIGKIDFDSPEGLTFNSTYKEVMEQFNLGENNFRKTGGAVEVISNKKITKEASYTFNVIGDAYDKVTVQEKQGWYTYPVISYQFNGEKNPNRYSYQIYLSGKGRDKGEIVTKAIEGKLTGYKKKEGADFYTDGERDITVTQRRRYIYVNVSKSEIIDDEDVSEEGDDH